MLDTIICSHLNGCYFPQLKMITSVNIVLFLSLRELVDITTDGCATMVSEVRGAIRTIQKKQ